MDLTTLGIYIIVAIAIVTELKYHWFNKLVKRYNNQKTSQQAQLLKKLDNEIDFKSKLAEKRQKIKELDEKIR